MSGVATFAESTQELVQFEARDSTLMATESAIVERTIVTRSTTASTPRRAITGPNPLEVHIPRTLVTERSVVTQTQHVRPTSNMRLQQGDSTPMMTYEQSRLDSNAIVSPRSLPGSQSLVQSTTPVNSYDPVLLNHDQSLNFQQTLPLPPSSLPTDPSLHQDLVTSDVEMENETPEPLRWFPISPSNSSRYSRKSTPFPLRSIHSTID